MFWSLLYKDPLAHIGLGFKVLTELYRGYIRRLRWRVGGSLRGGKTLPFPPLPPKYYKAAGRNLRTSNGAGSRDLRVRCETITRTRPQGQQQRDEAASLLPGPNSKHPILPTSRTLRTASYLVGCLSRRLLSNGDCKGFRVGYDNAI